MLSASNGNIIFAAGAIAILYHPESNKQLKYYCASSTIISMAISDDDRYLALGEKGDNPSVLVV